MPMQKTLNSTEGAKGQSKCMFTTHKSQSLTLDG